MIYAIPYLLLIFFLGGVAFLYDKTENDIHKQYIVIASVVIFFIFFGLRGFILSDWIIYYPFFYECSFGDIFNYTLGSQVCFEPGFILLTLICKWIFCDYHFFVFICTLIDTILLLNFLRRRTSNIPLALMIYLVFEGLVLSTNLMRNSIAIFIFLNALDYLERRKPLQYFLLCLLALSFHFSSIIYFPLYFFFHKTCNKWIYAVIFAACNIIYLFHVSIILNFITALGIDEQFSAKVRAYTEYYNEGTGLSIGYLERLFTGILVFIYYNKLIELRKGNGVYINGLIAYFIMFFFFSEFQVLSKRFANLFAYGYWIVWIDLISCFAIENNKKLFQTFVFLYCLLRMVGSANLPDFNYDNLLFGIKSYQERLYIHNRTFKEP
jgi:hypothetical protein